MKVVNRTKYDTRALKAFLHRAFVSMGVRAVDRKRKHVLVMPARRRAITGCAYLAEGRQRTHWMTLRIPSPNLGGVDLAELYNVIRHENAHNLGIRHGEMEPDLRECRGPVPEWIPTWPALPLKAARPAPSKEAVAERKLAAAHARLKAARTALKRAETRVKRWAKRIRQYEARMAAFKHRSEGSE